MNTPEFSSYKSIFTLSQEELRIFLTSHKYSPELAPLLFKYLYKHNRKHSLPVNLLETLKKHFCLELPTIHLVSESPDGTVKFLMKLSDSKTVETVLIPFHKKYTVCLSSQVGCAMKCSFCYTGTMGLSRHLKSHEIIGQYMAAINYLALKSKQKPVSPNIVFMGQGEPLHNVDEVKKAINIMMEPMGLNIGPRQITLSTAGYIPGMRRLREFPPINIALSLHSPFNESRQSLIPINQHYPLEDIFHELDSVPLLNKQFITYEYLLIDGLNDRIEDADELQKWLKQRKAIINIIAFNPFPGSHYQRPSDEKVEVFKNMLVARKLRTMVRTTKGSDILAACGQLKGVSTPDSSSI